MKSNVMMKESKFNGIHFESIPVEEISMANYQRPVNMARAKRIVKEFDSNRMRPIELSYRAGSYWCFDGQHRLAAYKMMGAESIPAQIHYNLTYQQEAALFANQHKNECHIRKRDEWAARLEAGKECSETVTIDTCVKDFGYKIVFDGRSDVTTEIGCIGLLQNVYARHGINGLQTMLFVISSAWKGKVGATHRDVLGGILKIMDTYPEKMKGKEGDIFWNRFRDRMASVTPTELQKKSHQMYSTGAKAMAAMMAKLYNQNLKQSSRLDLYRIK